MRGQELLTFVVYDIEDDRIRLRIANVCRDYGLAHIQYSVFSGPLDSTRRGELHARLADTLGGHQGKHHRVTRLREGRAGAAQDRAGRLTTMVATTTRLELTVTDLKQWAYCPRIPFYRYVLPVEHVRTYKMQRGGVSQSAVEALERRRRFREYGLTTAERRFDVWLRSARLELSGRIDLLLVTPTACFPVDFKDTEGGVRRNHRLQLVPLHRGSD